MTKPERDIVVYTFCNPGETRKSKVHAYTLWASEEWSGCKRYTVKASNGVAAKKLAIALRLADEEKETKR